MRARLLVCGVAVGLVVVGLAGAGVGRWGPPSGPEGGNVGVLAVDPERPGIVYAGSGRPWFPGGGIFRSANGGRSWRVANEGLEDGTVLALAVSPREPATVYAGTPSGVVRSSDRGRTWAPAGLERAGASALALDPREPGVVYAAAGLRVFRSTDGGRHWREAAVPARSAWQVGALALDPRTPKTLYAGVWQRLGKGVAVYKSTDGGRSWRPTGLRKTGMVFSLAIDPRRTDTVYAGTARGVFKTVDGGRRWVARRGPVLTAAYALTLALVVDPREPRTVYAAGDTYSGGGGVAVSTDGGRSWRRAERGITERDVVALALDRRGGLYAGTSRSGVFKSTNGGRTWAARNDGLTAMGAGLLAVDPRAAKTVFLVTESGNYGHGLYRSRDGGRTWRGVLRPEHGTVSSLAFHPDEPETIYAAARGVLKSIDGGAAWFAVGLTELYVQALVMAPDDSATLYAGASLSWAGSERIGGGVYRSTNGGRAWDAAGLGALGIEVLAVDPLTPSTLYAASDYRGVFKSVDGGETWRALRAGPADVSALLVDPTAPATLYAAAPRGVFKSTDGGRSWQLTGLAGAGGVSSLVIDPQRPSVLFAGTGGRGVYRTASGGRSWISLNRGSIVPWIQSLAIDSSGRMLFAGTGAGVFEYRAPR